MAEFTFESKNTYSLFLKMKKDGLKKSIVLALMVHQQSLTFVAGVLTIRRWGKESPSQTRSFKSWWMPSRISKHSWKNNPKEVGKIPASFYLLEK